MPVSIVIYSNVSPDPELPKEVLLIRASVPQNHDGALQKAESIYQDVLVCAAGHERKDVTITMFCQESVYNFGVFLALRKRLGDFRLIVENWENEPGRVDLSEFLGLGEVKKSEHVGGLNRD